MSEINLTSMIDESGAFQSLSYDSERRTDLDKKHDARKHVEFYMRSVEDYGQGVKEGRPIFKDVECVRYYDLADRLTVWDEIVTREHIQRWADKYKKFKDGVPDDGIIGIPLKEWPQIGTSRINELNKMDIYSVEQLASIPDGDAYNLGTGGISLVHQARNYLKSLKDTSHLTKLVSENSILKEDVTRMKSEMDQYKNVITQLQNQMTAIATMQMQQQLPPALATEVALPSDVEIKSKFKYKKKASEAFAESQTTHNEGE